MLAGLKIVELDERERTRSELFKPLIVLHATLGGHEAEFSNGGLAIDPQEAGCASLSDVRVEEAVEEMVELSFFLPESGKPCSGGEGFFATSTEIALNPLSIGGTEVASDSDARTWNRTWISGQALRIWALALHEAPAIQ
jgi:hypothetical protein